MLSREMTDILTGVGSRACRTDPLRARDFKVQRDFKCSSTFPTTTLPIALKFGKHRAETV